MSINFFKKCLLIYVLASILICQVNATDLPGGWKARSSSEQSLQYATDYFNHKIGWAVGIDSIQLTIDGGQTWQSCYKSTRGKRYWFNSVVAMGKQTALVCGFPYGQKGEAAGVLLRTRDLGKTWQEVDCGSTGRTSYCSMVFRSNRKDGYILSSRDGLLRSLDAGHSWKRVNPDGKKPATNIILHNVISLPDSGVVIVPVDDQLAISHDEAKTWAFEPFPQDAKSKFGWLFKWATFTTGKVGWAGLYAGACLHTRDGGKTWEILSGGFGQVWQQEGDTIWRATTSKVYRSEDNGVTWQEPIKVGSDNDRIEAMAFTYKSAHIVGGAEGKGHPFIADYTFGTDPDQVTLPEGVIPIDIDLPEDGIVTIQILDQQNQVVRNLINGQPLPKGKSTIKWNLATEYDYWSPFKKSHPRLYDPPATLPKQATPGEYHWRGLYHPPLATEYLYSYYPLKKHGVTWITQDQTGGWLADHSPPRCLVANGDHMWLGTFAEGGSGLIESDLDMKKLWGINRIELTTARALASDGDLIYFVEVGGWTGGLRLIQVNAKTKESRKLIHANQKDGTFGKIAGLAVQNNMACITFTDVKHMLLIDMNPNFQDQDKDIHILAKIPVEKAGKVRPYGPGKMAVIVGQTVSLLDLQTYTLSPIVTGLKNPFGLGIDKQGQFYVGEMEPLHQVLIYDTNGKYTGSIGEPGGHPVGPFNPQHMESPYGVEIDSNGHIWVTEFNDELKRTSVWDTNGKCINQVLGPPVYGGGGSFDPEDSKRMFYRGKEFRRDPQTGEINLVNIIWRLDDPTVDELTGGVRNHNFGGSAPSMPFHQNGKLWFRMWGAYGMGEMTVLFVYDKDRVRPVSAVGQTPRLVRERFGVKGNDCRAFAWTDANDDSRIQENELQFGAVKGTTTWGVRMNDHFQVAFSTHNGDVGFCFFNPVSYNQYGYPVYKMPDEFMMVDGLTVNDPLQVQGMMNDANGNAVAITPYIISVSPTGKVNWRYISRWSGLHGGLKTTAIGLEPGVLIAPLRFYGSVTTPALGEVLCIGTNYGVTHLMTADGLYVDRVFGDSRRSDTWRYNEPPTSSQLKDVSLSQEHFGGTFQKVRTPDGSYQYLYVVSPASPHCSVIQLHGLEKVNRLEGGKITVRSEHIVLANALLQKQANEHLIPRSYTIRRIKDCVIDGKDSEWPDKSVNGFKLAYDDQKLYVYYSGHDNKAVFQNSATQSNYSECFKTGDVLDVMLQTVPDLPIKRTNAMKGDIRLSLAMVDNQPTLVMYDYVIPNTPKSQKFSFSSPWRTVFVDDVKIIQNADIKVIRQKDSYSVEVSIPLSEIHLNPSSGLQVSGDVGRVLSDQTGSTRIDRIYWSNPNTRVVADVPSETELQPNLWGKFIFE